MDGPRGIVTVLNTPFTDDDRIDLASLERNVGYALESGVAGFLVPAMASEVDKLTTAEREQMVRLVLDAAGGDSTVIGGASAPTQEERVGNLRELLRIGCEAVLVALPYESDEQYEKELLELAAEEPPYLMLQDWDSHGYGVPVPLIARLFEQVECFKSLKVEVVPAGRKYTEVRRATDGRLHVAGGWAVSQMIEGLDRGVDAFMPTGMHEIYVRIYRLYREGRREEARALFHRLMPVLGFSNQHLDISIHFFKRLLHRQGIYATAGVREPILPFDDIHVRIADELIADVMQLCASLPDT